MISYAFVLFSIRKFITLKKKKTIIKKKKKKKFTLKRNLAYLSDKKDLSRGVMTELRASL